MYFIFELLYIDYLKKSSAISVYKLFIESPVRFLIQGELCNLYIASFDYMYISLVFIRE